MEKTTKALRTIGLTTKQIRAIKAGYEGMPEAWEDLNNFFTADVILKAGCISTGDYHPWGTEENKDVLRTITRCHAAKLRQLSKGI